MASDADFIAEAREQFKLDEEREHPWRSNCLEDLRFSLGEVDGVSTQWPIDIQQLRTLDGRPCHTINRVPQFVRQVTNEGRQNRPSITISPVDGEGDIETAEVLQGLVRHIETNSFADIAYSTAREHMVRMGFGYVRLRTDYIDEESFDQEILIDRVLNPFSVYFGAANEPDYSDADHAFIAGRVTKEQHRRMWPKSEVSSLTDFSSIGDDLGDWMLGENDIRIMEYFYRSFKTRKMVLIEDQSLELNVVGFEDEFEQYGGLKALPQGVRVLRERTVQIPTIHWCKINGKEKLESTDWPGRFIPLIPFLGDEFLIEGRRHISGMVRAAKPVQTMYNYWVTALTEMIAIMPRAPWLVAEGQLEGHEVKWDQANVRNWPYLEYKPDSIAGHPVPPPQRLFGDPPIAAITHAIVQADRDMKATFGIYDAGLGEKGPQESGRAILARKAEGDVSNYHLLDNEMRAIRFTGRQLVDLIPKVYTGDRVVRLVLPDNTTKTVPLNQPTVYKGVQKVFDVSAGKYDVVVNSGPSYQTKRQQAATQQSELIKGFPAIMPIAGDIMVRNMDIPGANEIADRLKKTLPPNLQEDQEGQQQIPQEVQSQMQALMQQHEMLTQQLTAKTEELERKQAELDSKEAIAAMQDRTKREVAEMQEETTRIVAAAQLGSREAMEQLKQEIAMQKGQLDGLKIALEHLGRSGDRDLEGMRLMREVENDKKAEETPA